MEATNPTMGDGPVAPDIDECLRRLKALIDARANEGPEAIVYVSDYALERQHYDWFDWASDSLMGARWYWPEEPVWLTDGLSMPWIDVPQPKEEGK